MRIISYFFLGCFALAGSAMNAQNLDKVYEGTGLPSSQSWQEVKMSSEVNPIAGTVSQNTASGVLKLQSSNAADQFTQLGWYKTGLGLNGATGYTIEIKAKVIDASKNGAFNIQGFDTDGKGFRIGIYKEFLAESTNPLAATNVLKNGMNNSDGFHTYRIAVEPSGTATLYQDKVKIETFPVSAFYFDNIIENGGFEDGNAPTYDGDLMLWKDHSPSFYPDFITDMGDIYRKSVEEHDDYFVHTGKGSLIIDNMGAVMPRNADPKWSKEGARTRELPVKANTDYNISIARKRAINPVYATDPDDWAWRDMGAFWNTQIGVQTSAGDQRDPNAMWGPAWENFWQIHNQTVTAPGNVESIRFEFPSWQADHHGSDREYVETAFDDFYFSENFGVAVGVETAKLAINNPTLPFDDINDPRNLISNGGFEDYYTNNDGSEYAWDLSDSNDNDNNHPMGSNPVWGNYVRLQINDKPGDEIGGKWAHSGNASMRYSTDDKGTDFNFAKELDANKTYRFNFWIRTVKWPERAWLNVAVSGAKGDRNAEDILWGHEIGTNDYNFWMNIDVIFTTTAEKKTLQLYLDDKGGWYNLYLDDLVLYEVTEDPHAGKNNLFPNGGFEDVNKEITGDSYTWALASEQQADWNDNYPVKQNDFWGAHVRLQDIQKGNDTGKDWARSGSKSLRVSYLGDRGPAQAYEGKAGEGEENDPIAWEQNIHMEYDLAPNKTYTLTFWIKAADWDDRGSVYVANGDLVMWGGELNRQAINWSQQTIKFSTTSRNHTLKMYTKFGSWFNFYLDDIALYEESSSPNVNDFLFFGKSMGTQSANVEIEYVAINTTGAYAPDGLGFNNAIADKNNLTASSNNGELTLSVLSTPASVAIYDVTGKVVAQIEVQSSKSINLPKGVYIVKSASQGVVETLKVVNK